jgi:hypothetical protein
MGEVDTLNNVNLQFLTNYSLRSIISVVVLV